MSVANMVRSTLGPRGMLKLIVNRKGERVVTNDGSTVLGGLTPQGPSSKILVNAAKEHRDNEGDGTTTLTVLIGELLQEADKLIFRGVHPHSIIQGFRKAHQAALRTLSSISQVARDGNIELQPELNTELIIKQGLLDGAGAGEKRVTRSTGGRACKMEIASTILSSKFSPLELKHLAGIAVDLSETAKSIDMIRVIKIHGGEVCDSSVSEGIILEGDVGPGQKTEWDAPRVLVVNTSLDADKIKVFGAKASVESVGDLVRIEEAEKQRMREKIEKISEHADIVVNRQLIYDYPTQEFTQRNKISIERADFSGVEMLAQVLGACVLSTFDSVSDADTGTCRKFRRVKDAGRVFLHFSGLPKSGACTLVLRGPSEEIVEEAHRSIIGVVRVLLKLREEGAQEKKEEKAAPVRFVYGGGSAECAVGYGCPAETESERAYFRALLGIPRALAENAGLSPIDALDELRKHVLEGRSTYGVGLEGVECMHNLGVKEPARLKESIWTRASETAEMLIRCDGIIRCRPRERVRE